MPLPHTVHLVIQNNVAELPALTNAMDHIGAEHGMPKKSLHQLQVALDEIVSNVIKYAWPEGGAHDIEIRITARADGVEVEVVDDGRMFDPRDAPKPARQLPGRKRKIGGVGVQMTKQLVDRLGYHRKDNRNCTTLTKLCALGPAGSGRRQHE